MDYFYTEEQLMIKELAAKIAKEKIAPIAAHCDETETYPMEIVKILHDSDLWACYIPEEYGGLGFGMTEIAIISEELAKACVGITMAFCGTALGVFPIMFYGSDAQKEKYMTMVAEGKMGTFAITEAEAGSDAAAVKTKAVLDGDEYVLNGSKMWISQAGISDFYTVIARTTPGSSTKGLSAFVIDKDTPGFTIGKKEEKMGVRASPTCELIFNNCRIPKENLLSEEGVGFYAAMRTLDRARSAGVGAMALGLAQGAFDDALKYSTERYQFGQPISNFQVIQHMLADMAISIEAVRCMIYQLCKTIDSGNENYVMDTAMCKVLATDTAMKVTTDAVQIYGGYGYTKEYPVEKRMRDAKVMQIYEGTNQIQRNIIGRELLKKFKNK